MRVLRACEAWGIPGRQSAELVASELVANAVLHGWGHLVLRLFDAGGALRIEVEDANPAPPVSVDGHEGRIGGYGMQIVERLARWGWEPTRRQGGLGAGGPRAAADRRRLPASLSLGSRHPWGPDGQTADRAVMAMTAPLHLSTWRLRRNTEPEVSWTRRRGVPEGSPNASARSRDPRSDARELATAPLWWLS